MAWPCITRACCINRFWTELDKADIAVPLVFTKYSDVAEAKRLPHHHLHHHQRAAAVAIETQQPPPGGEAPPAAAAAAAETRGHSAASVMRQDFRAWRVRPEPSCRPRDEYQPTTGPFNNQTQYQKDYKAWPIPKKHDHPWIHREREAEGGVEKSEVEEKLQEKKKEVKLQEEKKEVKVQEEKKEEKMVQDMKVPKKKKLQEDKVQDVKKVEIKVQEEKKVEEVKVQQEKKEVKESKVEEVKKEKSTEKKKVEEQRRERAAADAVNRQIQEVMTTSSSYRTEFKAYKDVKPVKAIKAAAQYKPPEEESSLETSYSATYRGEQVKAPPTDNKLQERRRIRSLYNEPSSKEPKVDKPVSRTKPKKSAPSATMKTMKTMKTVKTVKTVKEKPLVKKKTSAVAAETKPEAVVTKKSKEISNRLAEANQ